MSEALGTTLVFVLVFIVVPMRTPTDEYRYQRCLDCGRTRDIPAVGPPP